MPGVWSPPCPTTPRVGVVAALVAATLTGCGSGDSTVATPDEAAQKNAAFHDNAKRENIAFQRLAAHPNLPTGTAHK
ncbi:hypothetical protein ABLO09_17120, partial [Mycobacterium tuberculosis]